MLSHSPPFPLTIDYDGQQPLSKKDEKGALLSLQKHDCVRHIQLLCINYRSGQALRSYERARSYY